MTKEYTEIVTLNSTMLGKLLTSLDDKVVSWFDSILSTENVKKFFADEELVDTVNIFFRNDLNIIRASKEALVHRNTMIYRLEKIKKLLGLDIKKFEDAVTLQIILLNQKLKDAKQKRVHKKKKKLTIQELC